MAPSKTKPLDIALQGGGAHGAFTWGVLDYLLEDGRLRFASITAASAGAMNATVMAYGLSQAKRKSSQKPDPELAREYLETFWRKVSDIGTQMNLWTNPISGWFPEVDKAQEWLSRIAVSSFLQTVSPYQFNPMDINPLKDILESVVDFEALQHCTRTRLYIAATNVASGKVRVFNTSEVTSDAVMASACLPNLFKAVEIDGHHYWDGGYSGNPPLWPLFYDRETRDVLVVHINPIERREIPKTSADIQNRINEISFNTALLKEMRAVAFVQRLINEDMLKDEYKEQYSNILFHSIRADKALEDLSSSTKMKTDWDFILALKERGRDMAAIWLKAHFQDIGKKSSVDLHEEFLDL